MSTTCYYCEPPHLTSRPTKIRHRLRLRRRQAEARARDANSNNFSDILLESQSTVQQYGNNNDSLDETMDLDLENTSEATEITEDFEELTRSTETDNDDQILLDAIGTNQSIENLSESTETDEETDGEIDDLPQLGNFEEETANVNLGNTFTKIYLLLTSRTFQ